MLAIQKRTKTPNILMTLPKSKVNLSQKDGGLEKTGSKHVPKHEIVC